jgi:MFS family permease
MKSSSSLTSLYLVIAFCNILVNLDHGIIPAATKEIKEDLDLAEVELGMLGSIVYAGLIFGSLTAGQIFQKYNSKSIILVAVGAYAVGLLAFPFTQNILLLGISRFLVGFFQVSYNFLRNN